MSLQLRDYQHKTLDALRDGFKSGKRSQILYAPTGAGKTEMAIALLEATKTKGNKAAMLLDRIILCDQTSQRLEKYKIDHGVMQSGHWRWRPYENIQVCSAQTLEKRGSFPGLNLLIVDECHQTRRQTIEFIKNNPDVRVIGLTATPFTKGLAHSYESVISTITTKQLVDQKILVPLRVFISKEIDMTGAKKVAGEWSQKDTTERGIKITGDIVAEWVKKTHEIFGGPRKTIVFCSGVEHGASLSREFADKGYNFVSISYRDDDSFKTDAIEEFSKPDSSIHGLIATDILTKGFDVPDVMIGVSARPFSKSLSSHIQQMGRIMRGSEGKEFGLWLCLAKGSKVLTDKGLVPIDKVTLDHKIWDGTNFVTHGGAVCNGIQKVITYQGLTATPGHLVHTSEGWRTFGECARKQIRITQTGFGGQTIRLREDIRPSSFMARGSSSKIHARLMRMCDLWIQKFNFTVEFAKWENAWVSFLQSARAGLSNVAIQQSPSHESKMLFTIMQTISRLWRKRCGVQIFRGERRNALDNETSWHSKIQFNGGTFAYSIRQNQSIRTLRARKFEMDFCGNESIQQARQSGGSKNAQVQDSTSRNNVFRQHAKETFLVRNDKRTGDREIPQTIHETEREVWDILDAGPNNRFTCEGLLVHNCHSGNYLRFREDWDDVYENGVSTLDDGKEKTRKEPTEKEKKDLKCPVCEAYFPAWMDSCASCGHIRERKNKIIHEPGSLEELKGAGATESKQEWWSMLQWYVQNSGWSRGRAAHTYREKFGVWPRGLVDVAKPPTNDIEKFIRARLRQYMKGKREGWMR